MATITLSPDHGYVLLVAGAVGIQFMIAGGAVMSLRSALFGKAFQERPAVKAMAEEHKKNAGRQTFCEKGYPDMGSGKFSEQLTYSEWLAFNNAQRAHQNMLETLPGFYATLFGAGAMHPKLASWFGAFYIVGRLVYKSGYLRSGAKGREAGALISGIGTMGLLGTCLYAGYQLAQPLKRFA